MSAPRHLLLALKSPLQAINAIEYCHSAPGLPAADSVTAVLFTPTPRPTDLHDLIVELLRSSLPGVTVHLGHGVPRERPWWERFGERRRARDFVKRVAHYLADTPAPTELLVGDFRSRECRHLAGVAASPDTRLVLLDDGSATHQIAKYRRNPASSDVAPMFPTENARTRRLRRWGVQLPAIARATFFTHYDITCPPQDSLLRHRYPFWRSRLRHAAPRTSDDILVLGMSHVEKGLTDLDRYLRTMTAIKAHYGNRPVLYRPHRDEHPDKLAHVARLGFTLAPSALPVEIVLLQADTLPREVASIASSALDNLAILLGENVQLRCFEPPAGYCNPALAAHFTDIIRYHQKNLHDNLATTSLA